MSEGKVTITTGRGSRIRKRPAYLSANYVLDESLQEPLEKSPRLDSQSTSEIFEDAEENDTSESSTPGTENQDCGADSAEPALSDDEQIPHPIANNETQTQDQRSSMEEQLKALVDSLTAMTAKLDALQTKVDDVQAKVDQAANPIQPNLPVENAQTVNVSQAASTTSITSSSTHSRSQKLVDLPMFSGVHKEWPGWVGEFDDTTALHGYNTVQNNSRLKRCIIGPARVAVDSMLIHHANVPEVIERLRARYGRPEKITRDVLEELEAVKPMSENQMRSLVPFADQVNNTVNVLKSCQSKHHLDNPTLLEKLVLKLPFSRQLQWVEHQETLHKITNVEDFNEWLKKVADLIDIIPIAPVTHKSTTEKKDKGRVLLVKADKIKTTTCNSCHLDHKTTECKKYADLPIDAKWDLVSKGRLCFMCLEKGHQTQRCRQKLCGVNGCRGLHHKSLHKDSPSSDANKDESGLNANAAAFEPTPKPKVKARVMSTQSTEEQHVLFKIIPVKLYGPKGEKSTFALIDEAATLTLMNKSLALELGLHGAKTSLSIKGIDETVTVKEAEIVDSKISGTFSQAPVYDLKGMRVVDGLDLPMQKTEMSVLCSKFKHLQNLPLEDFDGLPQLLIGLKHAHLGAPIYVPMHQGKGPISIQTKLGYLIYGPKDDFDVAEEEVQHVLLTNAKPALDELHEMIKQHYAVEDFGVRCAPQVQSTDDQQALQILEKTTKRIPGGFESGLLWSKENVSLPESYIMAKQRLISIERKMKKDDNYAALYQQTIADYLMKGYARELTYEESRFEPERTWYLPHFGVINPNKPGKFRLVFDGAAPVNGVSLNSTLLTGPDLNQPLVKVLWKFREKSVGVCGDIREMYHQIKIIKEDTNAQRFLWRWNPNEPIKKYVMDSMTFGSTSSPTTAQFVKNQNALEYQDVYPAAVDAILHSHYVDDYVCSYSNEDEAIKTTHEVINIHRHGGFELRNFTSNSNKVVKDLNGSTVTSLSMDIEQEDNIDKILGLHWNVDADTFTFQLKFTRISPEILNLRRHPTKREMLSFAMSIYDPFGFIANLSIHIKVLVQDIWRSGVSWDEPVPDPIYKKWCLWFEQLDKVKDVNIPRCYSPNLFSASTIELHTMVDASEVAFCAVSYLRMVFENRTEVAFVAGKTKCAPLKELSVPRLELQAAVLGCRLGSAIRESHSFNIDRCYFWSDSMTVLYWIKDSKCRFKPFVRNRVSEILDSSNSRDWYYVPTGDNVADDSTRDVYPPTFHPESRWTTGPDWLFNAADFPKQPDQFMTNAPAEEVHRIMLLDMNKATLDVNRFSDFWKLKRTVAWILRFVLYLRSKRTKIVKGEFLPSELHRAEQYLCRQAQVNGFSEDYEKLQHGSTKKLHPDLIKLMPYVDEKGIMRVSGRIDNAPTVPMFTKRPIVCQRRIA